MSRGGLYNKASSWTLLIRICFIVCAIIAGVLIALNFQEAKALFLEGLAAVRNLGPVWFFVAFAVLPAIGCPLTLFMLAVGPTFVPQLGLATVIVLTATSLAVNLALSYWLARYAARPLIEAILRRLGYSMPEVARGDHLSLIIFLRYMPGPPHLVQCYLLGLAKVHFGIYMLVSFVTCMAWALAFILFGDAIMHGQTKTVIMAVFLIIALITVTLWLRKRISSKRKSNTVRL